MIPLSVTVPAAVALAITAGLMIQSGPPASVGAGIQAGPVYVTMAPGTTEHARVEVQDTGSATETLAVIGGRETSDGRIVPFSWVRRASVTVAPEVWRTVVFTIAVPPGTAPGQYRRYVGASAAPGTPDGLSLGAAAFANLVITVTPSATSRHTQS